MTERSVDTEAGRHWVDKTVECLTVLLDTNGALKRMTAAERAALAITLPAIVRGRLTAALRDVADKEHNDRAEHLERELEQERKAAQPAYERPYQIFQEESA